MSTTYTMSTPTEGGPSNGHLSPERAIQSDSSDQHHESDSDFSDARNAPARRPSSSPSDIVNDTSHFENDAPDMVESDEQSEDNASADGDFDMEESPQSDHDEIVIERPSSSDSNRASKRKVNIEEDEYIKANPELYGLRRSVCHPCHKSLNLVFAN